jgi:hypothetical protein
LWVARLAVAIDQETRISGEDCGRVETVGQLPSDGCRTYIEGDVAFEGAFV